MTTHTLALGDITVHTVGPGAYIETGSILLCDHRDGGDIAIPRTSVLALRDWLVARYGLPASDSLPLHHGKKSEPPRAELSAEAPWSGVS